MEGWPNSIAGPLYAITATGGCEYVYSRDDAYFANVTDPVELRTRLLEWHAGLSNGIERFDPASVAESTDLAFMRSVASQMKELIERACDVEQSRWETVRQT